MFPRTSATRTTRRQGVNLRFQNINDRWRHIVLEVENTNKGTRIAIFTTTQTERLTFYLHFIFTWSLAVDKILVLSAKGRELITSSPFPVYSCSIILKRSLESMLSISYKLQLSNYTRLAATLVWQPIFKRLQSGQAIPISAFLSVPPSESLLTSVNSS